MPVTRMRMRPWLEAKIESKSIPKLMWLDKERKVFSIPWIHGARHGWKMDKDACLFKEWAIHTGKFQPGVTDPDPKTWKANFRCAMNSLEDIEEMKDQSVNKGSGAMRVYRMLQVVTKKGDKRSKTKDSRNKKKNKATASKIKAESMVTKETNLSGDQNSHTCLEDKSMQENTVDSTGNLDLSQPRYEEPAPEWSTSVEIVADSTNDIYSSFQVSPLHSPEFPDDEAAIIQMTEQLEMDQSQWQQSNINGKGFLSNEVGTADSFPSAENWGFNSGTEIELRFSTELKGGLSENIDRLNYFEPWTNNSTSSLQQITCTL